MKRYSIMAASLFSLTAFYNITFADEVTDLISRSEASGAKSANEASRLIDDFRNNSLRKSESVARMINKNLLSSVSISKQPKQGELKNIPLAHEGKGNCKDKDFQGSGKCPSSLFESLEAKQGSGASSGVKLLVFVSRSVPADSIKELWNQAQRVGAKLLFRGLVGGSFKETQNYIQELGIVADIDPVKFDEFGISQVPAFILSQGGKHDKMVGNVSLSAFLEQSSASGSLQKEAGDLYLKLQGEQP